MLDTGVSIFIMPQSQNTSLCSSSIDIKHESSGTNITTHTQVQPVIDVPAKTNASTGQVVSPPAEGGVVKTTPTQEAPPTTSTVSENQVPSQNTTGADRPQTAAPKSRQTSLDGLLGSWTSAIAGWFKKVSAEYVKEGGGEGQCCTDNTWPYAAFGKGGSNFIKR